LQCGACATGECCTGNGTCGSCLVFVTSSPHTGNLGGLTGADAICQARADEAGLPGDYLAWLSDLTGSPNSRFVRATVPYRLVSGTIVADNYADLADGSLDAPINITETGATVPAGTQAWTDTGPNDEIFGLAPCCQNWQSASPTLAGRAGDTGATNVGWTTFINVECAAPDVGRRLYCFQQR
jgi:hypothetical protein